MFVKCDYQFISLYVCNSKIHINYKCIVDI